MDTTSGEKLGKSPERRNYMVLARYHSRTESVARMRGMRVPASIEAASRFMGPRQGRVYACPSVLAFALFMILVPTPKAFAARLGGAYYVDDAEIGKPGSCEFESWSSFAANGDRIAVFSPACVVNFGAPIELGTHIVNLRSDGQGDTIATLTAKTVPIPIGPSGFGLAIAGAVIYDPGHQTGNGFIVNIPVSFDFIWSLRVNVNYALWVPRSFVHWLDNPNNALRRLRNSRAVLSSTKASFGGAPGRASRRRAASVELPASTAPAPHSPYDSENRRFRRRACRRRPRLLKRTGPRSSIVRQTGSLSRPPCASFFPCEELLGLLRRR
jgi:hypothetical protein